MAHKELGQKMMKQVKEDLADTVKVEQDVKYIRTWSIASDIKILLKTVVVVITGRGAF